jgi:hypothetical protein
MNMRLTAYLQVPGAQRNIAHRGRKQDPIAKGMKVMTRRFRIAARVAAATLGLVLYASSGGAAPKQPRIETGPDAEVTHDGLVRVQKSVVDAAWVKPTFDLTPYKKLMVVSQGIAFRKLEPVSDFQARNETQFPVKEENKERLSRELKTAFETELAKLERYELVSAPGPDVLLLVGTIIDVVSNIPPDIDSARFGRGGVYLTSVGEATLVMELRDSESGEILGRVADRRAAESPFAFEVNNVTAWTEVRRLGSYWASLLRRRLEEIEGV